MAVERAAPEQEMLLAIASSATGAIFGEVGTWVMLQMR